MSVKTTGAEWKKYYESWPDGQYHEDDVIKVNGVYDDDIDLTSVADADVLVISGGVIYDDRANALYSLESNFKKWRKAQSTVFMTIEVQKEQCEEVKIAVIQAGGKIK